MLVALGDLAGSTGEGRDRPGRTPRRRCRAVCLLVGRAPDGLLTGVDLLWEAGSASGLALCVLAQERRSLLRFKTGCN